MNAIGSMKQKLLTKTFTRQDFITPGDHFSHSIMDDALTELTDMHGFKILSALVPHYDVKRATKQAIHVMQGPVSLTGYSFTDLVFIFPDQDQNIWFSVFKVDKEDFVRCRFQANLARDDGYALNWLKHDLSQACRVWVDMDTFVSCFNNLDPRRAGQSWEMTMDPVAKLADRACLAHPAWPFFLAFLPWLVFKVMEEPEHEDDEEGFC
jgi:hypothetical protein